ncbi:MAG TPA: hypothetical protein VHO66_07155 [Ruminiclostridium sp.]|nr:hypothetical protein [Ruminiclostridium sp.]
MKKKYAIKDRSGRQVKTGMFTEPEVRMAAKAGLRVFEIENSKGNSPTEITQELTGLFNHDSHFGSMPH